MSRGWSQGARWGGPNLMTRRSLSCLIPAWALFRCGVGLGWWWLFRSPVLRNAAGRHLEVSGVSLLGAGRLSAHPAPPPLAPTSPLILNSPVPRGCRGPAGVATVAGMRRIPADLVHTGIAAPPGAEAGRSRLPQTPLAEPPAPRPGLPGPGLHPDPRRLVAAPPAAPTGLRSAAGVQRSLLLPLDPPSLPLLSTPGTPPLTRWPRSSLRWPRLLLAPAPGWASGRAASLALAAPGTSALRTADPDIHGPRPQVPGKIEVGAGGPPGKAQGLWGHQVMGQR